MDALAQLVAAPGPITALAPMQDVTELPFMRVMAHYGAPRAFFTEYFRVHAASTLEKHILASITDHGTDRPVFAQLIGEDLHHLRRAATALQAYPIAGVDLNMGCPAPKVYKKNVGGGLLREPEKIDQVLGTLRDACPGRFTVKMRVGFEDTRHFEDVLALIDKHQIDLLSLHGRTVKEMYRGGVHYDLIRQAKASVRCPVLANGNISSARKAAAVLAYTGCDGVMIGRAAIRNPWIFAQFEAEAARTSPPQAASPALRDLNEDWTLTPSDLPPDPSPRLADVRGYVTRLWEATAKPNLEDRPHVNRMKKFLNFVGQGVDPDGAFLHAMRRAQSAEDLFSICDTHLIANGRAEVPFAEEAFQGVVARPNHESRGLTKQDRAASALPTCSLDSVTA